MSSTRNRSSQFFDVGKIAGARERLVQDDHLGAGPEGREQGGRFIDDLPVPRWIIQIVLDNLAHYLVVSQGEHM
jgi:hypothetical protein